MPTLTDEELLGVLQGAGKPAAKPVPAKAPATEPSLSDAELLAALQGATAPPVAPKPQRKPAATAPAPKPATIRPPAPVAPKADPFEFVADQLGVPKAQKPREVRPTPSARPGELRRPTPQEEVQNYALAQQRDAARTRAKVTPQSAKKAALVKKAAPQSLRGRVPNPTRDVEELVRAGKPVGEFILQFAPNLNHALTKPDPNNPTQLEQAFVKDFSILRAAGLVGPLAEKGFALTGPGKAWLAKQAAVGTPGVAKFLMQHANPGRVLGEAAGGAGQQAVTNVATGRPVGEGVPAAAALGPLVNAGLGVGGAAVKGYRNVLKRSDLEAEAARLTQALQGASDIRQRVQLTRQLALTQQQLAGLPVPKARPVTQRATASDRRPGTAPAPLNVERGGPSAPELPLRVEAGDGGVQPAVRREAVFRPKDRARLKSNPEDAAPSAPTSFQDEYGRELYRDEQWGWFRKDRPDAAFVKIEPTPENQDLLVNLENRYRATVEQSQPTTPVAPAPQSVPVQTGLQDLYSLPYPGPERRFAPNLDGAPARPSAPEPPLENPNTETVPPARAAEPVLEAPAAPVQPTRPKPLPGEVTVTEKGGVAYKYASRPYTPTETDDLLRVADAAGAPDADVRLSELTRELGPERVAAAGERVDLLERNGALDEARRVHQEYLDGLEQKALAEVDRLKAQTQKAAVADAEETASAVSMRNTGQATNKRTKRTVNYTNIERVPVAERERLLADALAKNPSRGDYEYTGGAAGQGGSARDLVIEQGILPDDLGVKLTAPTKRAPKPKVTKTALPGLDPVAAARVKTAAAKALLDDTLKAEIAAMKAAASKGGIQGTLGVPDPDTAAQFVKSGVKIARAAAKYGVASAEELGAVLRETVGDVSDRFVKEVWDTFQKEEGAAKPPADGKRVVYHGTQTDFEGFKASSDGAFGPGVYVTPDKWAAETHARGVPGKSPGSDRPRVITAELELKRPFEADAKLDAGELTKLDQALGGVLSRDKVAWADLQDNPLGWRVYRRAAASAGKPKVNQALSGLGYDGIQFTSGTGYVATGQAAHAQMVAFDPAQVRSNPQPELPQQPKPAPDPKRTVGLANQVQQREREVLKGILKEPEKGIPESAKTFQERGKAILDAVKGDAIAHAEDLARRIAKGRQGIRADDFGVLLDADRRLKAEVDKHGAALDRLVKSGKLDLEGVQEKYTAAVARRQAFLDDVQKGKTEWHNIGMALQAGADVDTGNFADVLQAAERRKGEGLNVKEREAYRQLSDEYQKTVEQQRLDREALENFQLENARLEAQLRAKAEDAAEKAARPAAKRMARRERIQTDRKAILAQIEQIVNEASRANDVGSVVYESARFGMAAGKLAANYVEEGLLGAEELIAKVIKDFAAKGVTVQREDVVREFTELKKPEPRTKDQLQSERAKTKADMFREQRLTDEIARVKAGLAKDKSPKGQAVKSQRITELEEELKAVRKALAGPRERKPRGGGTGKRGGTAGTRKPVQRNWEKEGERLGKRIAQSKAGKGPEPRKPGAPAPAEIVKLRQELAGLEKQRLKTVADQRRIAKLQADLTAIAEGTYQPPARKKVVRSEEETTLRKMRNDAAREVTPKPPRKPVKRNWLKAAEGLKKRIAEEKAGIGPKPRVTQSVPPEIAKLRQELADAQKGRITSARERIRIERLKKELAAREAGTWSPKTRTAPTRGAEEAGLLAQRKALVKSQAEAQRLADAPAREAKRRAAILEKANQRLADLEEQLKTGNYRQVTPKERKLGLELEATRARSDYLRRTILKKIEDQKPKTALQKAGVMAGFVRGTVLGGDIGVLTRQGMYAWSRPVTAAKSAVKAAQNWRSEKAFQQWEYELHTRKINGRSAAVIRKEAGLSITDSLSQPEELVIARALKKLPGVNLLTDGLERFQTTFINNVRAELFDQAVRQGFSPDELKLRANFINSATGRSNAKQVPEWMSLIMTSPRYERSRWEMLGQPLKNLTALGVDAYKGKGLNRAAAANLQDLVVTAAGVVSMYKIAELAGYQVEWDPTKTEFLKMVKADERGVGPALATGAREAIGQGVNRYKGKEVWDVSAGLAPRIRDVVRMYVAFTHPEFRKSGLDVFAKGVLRTVSPGVRLPTEAASTQAQKALGVTEPKEFFTGFKNDDERQGLITLAPLILQSMKEALAEKPGAE